MTQVKNYSIEKIASEEGFTKLVRKMWDEKFFSERISYQHATPEEVNEAIEEQKTKILSRGESWFTNGVVEVKFLLNSWGGVQLFNNRATNHPLIAELFTIILDDQADNPTN